MKSNDAKHWNNTFIALGLLLMIFCISFKGYSQESNETVTDIDGNVYRTVKIGTQIWMAEDLRTTNYIDGTPIPLVEDNNERSTLKTGAYCYSDSLDADSHITPEYNWFAVSTGRLCPAGWHTPTDNEWETLINHLGGVKVAGGKLKEAGTTHWNPPNNGADDSSGFTALPENVRTETHPGAGMIGVWWSATEFNESDAWVRSMTFKSSSVVKINFPKNADGQIRCIKD